MRLADTSSIIFTSQMVQVTTEAKAKPTMTAFTTMAAAMNMPHGDRSCGSAPLATPVGRGGAGSGDCGAGVASAAPELADGAAGETGAAAAGAAGPPLAGAPGAVAPGAGPAGAGAAG